MIPPVMIFLAFVGVMSYQTMNKKEVTEVKPKQTRYVLKEICKPSKDNCKRKIQYCRDTQSGKFASMMNCTSN